MGNSRYPWRAASALALLSLFFATPSGLFAGTSDLFGFSARSIAMGGSVGAAGTDASGAYSNISSLSFHKRINGSIGGLYAVPNLTVNGLPQDTGAMASAFGGVAIPITKEIAVGLAFSSPAPAIATIKFVTPTKAHFVKYDQGDLLSFAIGGAYKIQDMLSLGAGVVLAMSGSGSIHAKTDIVNYRLTETDIALGVTPKLAPMLGATFRPFKELALAVSARGETVMDFKLDGEVGLGITDLNLDVTGSFFYHPNEIQLSAAVTPNKFFTLSGDVVYAMWSKAPRQMSLSLTPTALLPQLATDFPELGFVDIVIPSIGVEYIIDTFAIRMGYRLIPTAVPQQTGITNYLDCTEQALSVGFGFLAPNPLPGLRTKTRIDLFFQYRSLSERSTYKNSALDSVGDNVAGGSVIAAGGGVNIEF